MNPIKQLESEIEAILRDNELVRCYLNGWGTSSWDVYKNPAAQLVARRVQSMQAELARLRKRAGIRHKTSWVRV